MGLRLIWRMRGCSGGQVSGNSWLSILADVFENPCPGTKPRSVTPLGAQWKSVYSDLAVGTGRGFPLNPLISVSRNRKG
jgi:hypothetical protein